jgi:mannose-6-phosphate isomerase-like protein (cupin superfamily)
MVVDAQEFQLQPGQAYLIKPLEIHQISNKGVVDLEFLAVIATAWTPNDSFFTTEKKRDRKV